MEKTLEQIKKEALGLQSIEQEVHDKEKTHSTLLTQKEDVLAEVQKLLGEIELVDLF